MKKRYYIDTCIYLNLWQKEVDEKTGALLWKFAKDFLEKAETENSTVYYSGYLLKELSFVLEKDIFNKKLQMFNFSPNFKRINLSISEYNSARRIEKESNYEVSFYDIIHMLLTKKTKSLLITRDNKLIDISRKYNLIVKRPEDLL